MVFSSTVFVFLFLPISLSVYFLVPNNLRDVWLLSASLFFYAWGEAHLVALLFVSIIVDYFCGLLIAGAFNRTPTEALTENGPRSPLQQFGLVLSITANLALLAVFKYFNFGIDSFNAFIATIGFESLQWDTSLQITLPLGISFFTFQSMSYTIDVYLGRTKATRNILKFAMFVALFPQLVAGPIVRYRQIAGELHSRKVTPELVARGVKRFVVGLGKKMIIANVVALPADQIFALPDSEITASVAWFAVLCYTLQIFFDFSGYSDMAIGLGLMLGFHFPENFNYPYVAQSIREFWRRWHISLSTWFRDYLYIPLGGNKKGALRTNFNLIAVFFLCGLWHGASWTFVAWGLLHGAFLVLERTRFGAWLDGMWRPFRHTYTILVTMLGWTLFRSETFSQATSFFVAMAGFASPSRTHSVAEYWRNELAVVLVLGVLCSTPWVPLLKERFERFMETVSGAIRFSGVLVQECLVTVYLFTLFILCAMLLGAQTYNPFIYFRF